MWTEPLATSGFPLVDRADCFIAPARRDRMTLYGKGPPETGLPESALIALATGAAFVAIALAALLAISPLLTLFVLLLAAVASFATLFAGLRGLLGIVCEIARAAALFIVRHLHFL